MEITKNVATRFTVDKQCFQPPQATVGKEEILQTVRALGCVQIDTISVIERSHYLAFWSRLGNYRKEWLDQLLSPDRKVFEYWAHAASIIPMENYRYFLPAMKRRQTELQSKARRWLKEKANLLETVLSEIKQNGPMSSKDFKQDKTKKKKVEKNGWWSWKPAKYALELLYNAGVLMVSRRENFQRYYDLTENVLPPHIDTSEPLEEEQRRFFIKKTLDAWGLAEPKDIARYFYTWSTKTNLGVKAISGVVEELESEDIITSVQVEGIDKPYLMLTKNLKNLEKIANTQNQEGTVSLISPFDNLTWSKSRTKNLFDYQPRLEIYFPRETRKFGYYALTILYGSQIVGRLDPKMHRDASTLEIRALELKEGFGPTKDFKQQLTFTLEDFMRFHNAENIRIAENCPRFLKIIQQSKLCSTCVQKKA